MAEADLTIIDSTKICKKCGVEKARSEFHKSKTHLDGLLGHCKTCGAEKNKAAYARHAEKRRASAKEYAERTKDRKSKYNRKYREAHAEEMTSYAKEWRKTHKVVRSEEYKVRERKRAKDKYANDEKYKKEAKDRSAAYKKINKERYNTWQKEYYKNNREKLIAYKRAYYKTWKTPEELAEYNKNLRIKHRAARQAAQLRYNTKRYGSPGEITGAYLHSLHKWQDHSCFHCRAPLNQKDTMDHLVCMDKGGTNNPYNVVLACGSCNYSKCAKILHLEWTPKSIAPAPRWHSIHCHSILKKMASKRGIACESEGDTLVIGPRRITIISTFWCQDLVAFKDYPATLFLDHEFLINPDMAFDEGLTTTGPVVLTKCQQGQQLYANGAGLVAYRKEDMAVNLDWFDPNLDELTLSKVNGLLHIRTNEKGR